MIHTITIVIDDEKVGSFNEMIMLQREQIKSALIMNALTKNKGYIAFSARQLKMSSPNLRTQMKRLGIINPQPRKSGGRKYDI